MCFFFNDTASTEIYTLSLHDALPISVPFLKERVPPAAAPKPDELDRLAANLASDAFAVRERASRSEEHTSELQSRQYLVCRLLLEKKKAILLKEKRLLVPTKAIAKPR